MYTADSEDLGDLNTALKAVAEILLWLMIIHMVYNADSEDLGDLNTALKAVTERAVQCNEATRRREAREFFIDNLLVRIHFIIVVNRWTGLAPWEFEFPFPGSLTSTFLGFK